MYFAICVNLQSVSALASSTSDAGATVAVIEGVSEECADANGTEQRIDVLSDGMEARGELVPTKIWDWSKGNYRYYLDNVTDYVMTSYVFSPDENGCLSISTDGISTAGENITISLKRSGTFVEHTVQSWTGNPQSIQGLGFSGLDPEKYYYFYFYVNRGVTANGGGIIHHP